jgi:hypothetical protein
MLTHPTATLFLNLKIHPHDNNVLSCVVLIFGPLTAIVLDRCVTKSTNTILFVKISMNEISNTGGFSKSPWKIYS